MPFEDIVGQKEVVEYLAGTITGEKIGHAYVFSGAEGIGKRTVAGIFANALLCSGPSEGKPCGKCQACMLYESGVNPDFRRVSAGGGGIGVDDIRKLLSDLMIKPLYSTRKVFVIEDAGDMTVQAQNCMLKTLEEPPPYAVLILTVSNYEGLLETIRSRVTKISFRKNTLSEVTEALVRKLGIGREEAGATAAWADGNIGRALEMAGSDEYKSIREKTFSELNKLEKAGIGGIFDTSAFFEDNREDADLIFDMVETYFRDMMVAAVTGDENMLINKDKKDIIFNNIRNYTAVKLAGIIGQIAEIRREIRQNANYMLAVENMLVKIVDGKAEEL
ncbi:MAG: DNA polymerase III subunit delta' [Clostridiales bacterium]|nr:DNA polymerase III subunit delta' [Clostridiales bacterium]